MRMDASSHYFICKKKIIRKNLYSEKFNIFGEKKKKKKKNKKFFLNKFITKMRYGGDSNKSLKNIFIKMYQDLEILKLNKIKNPIYTLINKNFSKIGQFIK